MCGEENESAWLRPCTDRGGRIQLQRKVDQLKGFKEARLIESYVRCMTRESGGQWMTSRRRPQHGRKLAIKLALTACFVKSMFELAEETDKKINERCICL